jgi:group I intron endonuclease
MIIYIAKNKLSGKFYIGQTSYDLQKRIDEHIRLSKSPKSKFHKAIKSYGSHNFDWEIIDTAKTKEELNEKEIKYIQKYNSIENGYNMVEGGIGGYNQYAVEANKKKRKGKTYEQIYSSTEIVKKLKNSHKERISEHNKIYGFDKLDKQTMKDIARKGAYGLMKTGYKHSKETIEKIRKSNQNKEVSEETKELISQRTKAAMKNLNWDKIMEKALEGRKKYWDNAHEEQRNKILEYKSQGLKVKEIVAKLNVSLPTYYARIKELKKIGKI